MLPWYFLKALKNAPRIYRTAKAVGKAAAAGLATASGGLAGYMAAGRVSKRKGGKLSKSSKKSKVETPSGYFGGQPTQAYGAPMKKKGGKRRRNKKGGKKLSFTPSSTSSDVQYINRKIGKKPKTTLKSVAKVARAGVTSSTFRWQRLSNYINTQGELTLDRKTTGTIPNINSTENMPIYIFDVSGIPHNGANLGFTTYSDQLCFQLVKNYQNSGLLPLYTWTAVRGDSRNGGNSTGFELETGSDQAQHQSSLWKWVEIQLDLIGPTSIPCKWDISLVQFKDEFCLNQTNPTGLPQRNSSDTVSFTKYDMFWEKLSYPLISHPMAKQHGYQGFNPMKTLYKQSLITQPKINTDLYTSGEEKIIKIFKWMNKLNKYDWMQDRAVKAPDDVVGGQTNPEGWANSAFAAPFVGNDYYPKVHPRKRIWLMVRAQNYTATANGTTAPFCPSFDVVIRVGHEFNN